MVYFTCNHCGESLKKGSVDKHSNTYCRKSIFLTCVDCMKDFDGETYVAHTKCITEDEKYSAKGFQSRAPSMKGEVKQNAWIELIQRVSEKSTKLPPLERTFMNALMKHDNIPQKKAKFHNFSKSIWYPANRDLTTVDNVWELLEHEKKVQEEAKAVEKSDKAKVQEKINGDDEQQEPVLNENLTRKEIKKRQKKEKYKAELLTIENDALQGNGISNSNIDMDDMEIDKKQKHKKIKKGKSKDVQEMMEVEDNNSDDQKSRKKKRKAAKVDAAIDAKKSRLDVTEQETSFVEMDVTNNPSKFKWSKTIVDVLEGAPDKELPVKRLRKKVLAEFESTGGTFDNDAIAKFNKKLSKIRQILLLKDRAKLKVM